MSARGSINRGGDGLAGRAIVLRGFGGPDELELRRKAWSKRVRADEILVRNHATSINPIEWKMREGHGLPCWVWRRLLGQPTILGLDYAGEVVAAGSASGFKLGDRVMGALSLNGAYADYVRVSAHGGGAVALVPTEINFAIAALLPFAGLVALAGLRGREVGGTLQGKKVLVIGATGGVGHIAVQMARHALDAAHVAAICSRRNVHFAQACGAQDILAYDDFSSPSQLTAVRPEWCERFDLIFDASGIDEYYTKAAPQLLMAGGTFVSIALPSLPDGRPGEAAAGLQAMRMGARLAARSFGGRYRLVTGLLAGLPGSDGLRRLAGWLEGGKVLPHAGASFDFADLAEAHRLSEAGEAPGKIAVAIGADGILQSGSGERR